MSQDVVITIPENFSVEQAAKLRDEINHLIETGESHFVMDFRNCRFIDSTGLGVLVAIYKRCLDRSGSLKVKNVQPQVMKIFNLTRLDKVFDIQS